MVKKNFHPQPPPPPHHARTPTPTHSHPFFEENCCAYLIYDFFPKILTDFKLNQICDSPKTFSYAHLFTGRSVKQSDKTSDNVSLSEPLIIDMIKALDNVTVDIKQNMEGSFVHFKRNPLFVKWARLNNIE